MLSSREQSKNQNDKLKDRLKSASADDFIKKGSDSQESDVDLIAAVVKEKKELTKSVSISLTDTDKGKLDGFATKLNFLLLDAGEHNPKAINRSDLVKTLIVQLEQMTMPELVEFYKNNRQ